MSNVQGLKRSVKSPIISSRMLVMKINGTLATPTSEAFGSEEFQAKEIIDLGAGNYTIIFLSPFEKDSECELAGWSSVTAGIDEIQVVAKDHDRITIQCNAAGVATDADVTLMVMGRDSRYNVAR